VAFTWLVDVRYLAGNPWKAVNDPCVVRAALLLMGDSGLRREEAASVLRDKLRSSMYGSARRAVWELTVISKRQKERTVSVSVATLEALAAHWGRTGVRPDGAGRPRQCVRAIAVAGWDSAHARLAR